MNKLILSTLIILLFLVPSAFYYYKFLQNEIKNERKKLENE